MKPCRTDIKILLALSQDARVWAGNLIYSVRLHVNVGDRLVNPHMHKLGSPGPTLYIFGD